MALPPIDILLALTGTYALYTLVRALRRRLHTTRLRGPPRSTFLGGPAARLYTRETGFSGRVFEEWAERYGGAYVLPGKMRRDSIVLCDPRAVAHVYAKDTYGYTQRAASKAASERLLGRGIFWADGDSHKRQRKTMTPGFSNAAIRQITYVFFDSAYKVKAAWDGWLESSEKGECIIEVQHWMNHISLDSIGLAGFSHDFGCLRGEPALVGKIFDSFSELDGSTPSTLLFLIRPLLPRFVMNMIPNKREGTIRLLNDTMGKIAEELLAKFKKEHDEGAEAGDRSVLGLLLKAGDSQSATRLTAEEVSADMKILIVAGYETTSISMTWALIELARHQDKQAKLRAELLAEFGASDPSWDQLTHGLPYLDAVVHEILRTHAPVPQGVRVAVEDDVIPLGAPVRTAAGALTDSVVVAKGTEITVPIRAMNMSTALWGPDAREFKPERWLQGVDGVPAHEVSGYKHLLTFSDGPRICLGKGFAVAEFKAVLSVLIRDYIFELQDPSQTKLDAHVSLLPRPKFLGESGPRVPLKVRRAE
ncbi:cytochrome P450 [Dentipellis sp. KUC8613]|nr:cytochrome P450 [Dentipellis sp. KUC8613]